MPVPVPAGCCRRNARRPPFCIEGSFVLCKSCDRKPSYMYPSMDKDFIGVFHETRNRKYSCESPEVFMEERETSISMTPVDKLNYEMMELYSILSPKEEEVCIRKHLLKKMVGLLEGSIGDATVSPFGSYEYGLFLPTSDFDIVICPKTAMGDSNTVLKGVRSIISKADFISAESIIHLSKAKIPILRCADEAFGYRFDISVGHANGLSQARYIKKTLSERPYMRPFVLLLKHFLRIRDISESKRGGLCSYAQFLMMLHFFQLHPLVQTRCIDPYENMGVLFLDFFQYYGFNMHGNAKLTIQTPGYRKKDDSSLIFSIEDPVDRAHDAGSLCANGHAIMDVFNHAYRIMSMVFHKKIPDSKSLSSLWMRSSKAEELWRERNIQRWRDMYCAGS
ncbi:UNVERIFIED_CONTAM: hypothetical protein PYX00_011027 [Menopon gallinae]|uniref:Poly(A) RNA polymerase mitochondrial-like central palm domain-containing protein n=1 Tax=Menopon gallinae TaxID=328185 RepID=A0AAW2H6E9_9NEOP